MSDYNRFRLLVVGSVVSLFLFGACVESMTKEPYASSGPETDAGPGTKVTPSIAAAAGTVRVLESFESGGRSLTVLGGYSVMNGLGSEGDFIAPVEGRMIVVPVTLVNTSNESGNFAFSRFQLKDVQGRLYDEIDDFQYSLWREERGYGARHEDYYPGESREEVLVFRVAPDANPLFLIWKGTAFAID